MERTARCSCGSVTIAATGEPGAVVACHCLECQRRTGSVMGVGAYYPEEQVTIGGETREYARGTDSGNTFVRRFCPQCGTTTHWYVGKKPGVVGIAVGAFADPGFPAPVRSVWEQSKHEWVEVSPATQHFPRGRG